MEEVGKDEVELKNLNFSRLSIFKTCAPEYVIKKALVNITQLPSGEIPNNDGNIVEYFNDKETYEIANKSDIFEFEKSSSSQNTLASLNNNKEDKFLTLEVKGDYTLISDNKTGRKRFHVADILRCILISSVVLGHLLESFDGPYRRVIYVMIYIFHMPYFVYISGWFAKFNPKKMIRHIFLPYIVFQTIFQAIG